MVSRKGTKHDATPSRYSCSNRRYSTDTAKGYPHGRGNVAGSVLQEAIVSRAHFSLWLEHVVEQKTGNECYWLMWYRDGRPTIPLSGVLYAEDLDRLAAALEELRARTTSNARRSSRQNVLPQQRIRTAPAKRAR